MCGRLIKALYGTRDAAQNWEFEYSDFLVENGFTKAVSNPCMFHHKLRDIRIVVHGDDFTVLASCSQLDWFRACISGKFEVKFRGRLGPGQDEDRSIRILNRVLEWTDEGLKYEADQRHAEIIIKQLGLRQDSKAVSSPSIASSGDESELSSEQSTMYRAMVARANYLAQDRGDIAYAVKELCRHMSKPRNCDWTALKRLGRYLLDKTRAIVHFPYQDRFNSVSVWTDTDHAGCTTTRKSTSGGVVMLGQHLIKAWSSTQSVIALSSGEAEYYGLVKGASVGIGVQSMLSDFAVTASITLHTDSSAAKGIGSRRGLGKLRHIELAQLWVQDLVSRGKISITKIAGTDNIADALTKHSSRERLSQHMSCTNQSIARGRHPIMPRA